MKDFDQQICDAIALESISIPECVHLRTEQLLESLPEKAPIRRLRLWPRVTALAASLLFVLVVMLPNISPAYAEAVQKIPVIGDLVEIFTVRSYRVNEGNHNLNADIASVNDPQNPGASDLVNKDVDALTSAVIRRFYDEMEIAQGEGVGAINIDYETVTNTPEWFTLKLMVEEIRGSTNSYARYYHIHRTTGRYVHFGDLVNQRDFPVLEEMILRQMEQQMAEDSHVVYMIRNGDTGKSFVSLDEDQNFYFTENGDLVIAYDRYEVAPGFMGNPEFTLPREDIEPYLQSLCN